MFGILRMAKQYSAVLLWTIVVLLIWLVAAAGDDWVGAETTVKPTDTTVAGGSGSDGRAPRSCPYGSYTLPNGTTRCRACPQRTYWSSGSRCIPVTANPDCPKPKHAIVSSWSHCVPIFCPPNPGNPNLLEWRNLSDGSCTNLEDACSADDEKWFPEYMGCKKETCRHGRTSTGECRSHSDPESSPVPVHLAVDPEPPSSVTADGDSSSGSATARYPGQIEVRWSKPADAIVGHVLAGYDIRYGRVTPASTTDKENAHMSFVDLSVSSWEPTIEIRTASTTSHIIDGLAVPELYRVEVSTVYRPSSGSGANETSDWQHAYSYPTVTALPMGSIEEVGGVVPVNAYLDLDPITLDGRTTDPDLGQFRYVLCTNAETLPPSPTRMITRIIGGAPVVVPAPLNTSERNTLLSQIRAGLHSWNHVSGISATWTGNRTCTTAELSRTTRINMVRLASLKAIPMVCGGTPAGCAYKPRDSTDSDRAITAQIVLRNNLVYHTNYTTRLAPITTLGCSEMYLIAMHEVGHIFGLGDTHALDSTGSRVPYGRWPSVMSFSVYSNYHDCRPTQLDVAAIKAIYQSR